METSNQHWLDLLNKELDGTSDRSCVIVAASIIDHLLIEALRAYLVPCSTSSDTLFDGPTAPLGNFDSRINLAYRSGLISSQAARDLHIVRRMRNEQAHSVAGRTFEDPALMDQLAHLEKSLDLKKRVPFLLTKPYDTVRGHFIIIAVLIVVHLDEMRRTMVSVKELTDDPLYTVEYHDGNSKSG